ncbi:uncharacterized protein LOC126652350 [Myiozetetes cayanensis]|uniref:uncharacterized protein LOC126652350 n=1 Tax=Myiozetetes cayanensis TaxID=478635 RepID=UPI002160DA36|nr:uncharacterized protein LOC126652350 [Myiozetetes cayanensis]
MGLTASAVEKAVVDSLMKLADKTDAQLPRSALIDLLCWCRRRGFFSSTQDIYNTETWRKVGKDLWESVQLGTKGAKTLAKTYRTLRTLIERLHGEAQVAAAVKAAVRSPDSSQTKAERAAETQGVWPPLGDPPDYPPLTCLVMTKAEQIAWGLDDEFPPWNPSNKKPLPEIQIESKIPGNSAATTSSEAAATSSDAAATVPTVPPAPPVPTAPPLPTAPTGPIVLPAPIVPTTPVVEEMETDDDLLDRLTPLPPEDGGLHSGNEERRPTAYSELRRELRSQRETMTDLLHQMERLDRGSKRRDIKKAYKDAHKSIMSADVTILPISVWPSAWELDNTGSTISGIGGSRLTQGLCMCFYREHDQVDPSKVGTPLDTVSGLRRRTERQRPWRRILITKDFNDTYTDYMLLLISI